MRSFFSSFFMSFSLTLLVIFTAHNINQYNKSFDNCERLIREIDKNLATYERELKDFEAQVYGGI